MPSTSSDCPLPAGEFANLGTSNNPEYQTPPLAAILFEDKLAGFPVESIRISLEPAEGQLLIRGVLAGVELRQNRTIASTGESCETLWQGSTRTGTVNATLRSEAILYTGGLFLPLSERYLFTLHLAEDGSLLVRLDVKATVLFALLAPFAVKDVLWLRYEPYPASNARPKPPVQESSQ